MPIQDFCSGNRAIKDTTALKKKNTEFERFKYCYSYPCFSICLFSFISHFNELSQQNLATAKVQGMYIIHGKKTKKKKKKVC